MSTTGDVDAVSVPGPGEGTSEVEEELWTAFDGIPDPHMPVSIVELGMIYTVTVEDGTATVEMTFPCMGCPAYDMIQEDIEDAARTHSAVDEVEIEIVWDPVWSKDMLAPEVREQLGNWGIAL